MTIQKYSLGLSSFPLISSEIVIAATVYQKLQDWDVTRNKLKDENLVQKTRESTRKVASNEVVKRLKRAYAWEIDVLVDLEDVRDQNFICLCLAARQYPLLQDFIEDFLMFKKEGGDLTLDKSELINWLESLSSSHDEIAALKSGSFRRLYNHMINILSEGGLLKKIQKDLFKIISPGISSKLQNKYEEAGTAADLRALFYSPGEIDNIRKNRL